MNRTLNAIAAALTLFTATFSQTSFAAPGVGAATGGASGSTDATRESIPMSSQSPPDFATLDANRDGSISKAELKVEAAFSDRFPALDTDSNGKLSQAEFAATSADDRKGAKGLGDRAPDTGTTGTDLEKY